MEEQNKNAIKGFLGIGIIIVIIVGVVMVLLPEDQTKQESVNEINSPNIPENQSKEIINEGDKTNDSEKLDTEEKILEFIKNYKGKDNKGSTLSSTFDMIAEVSYPGEKIFESPSTTVSLFAHKDFESNNFDRYWKVELEIKTYRETAYYEWVVDNETNEVYPGNEYGQEILDIID